LTISQTDRLAAEVISLSYSATNSRKMDLKRTLLLAHERHSVDFIAARSGNIVGGAGQYFRHSEPNQ
jgi:hypothetical protein